jgi:hypothetical protein
MFEIVGRLRCPVCSEPVQIDDKVFLDIINTVIHQKCYYKSPQRKLPIKDKSPFQKMLLKYSFFHELFRRKRASYTNAGSLLRCKNQFHNTFLT